MTDMSQAVIEKLMHIQFDLSAIRFKEIVPSGAIFPTAKVMNLRSSGPHEIELWGELAHASDSDEEIVARARRALINFVTHEIDEVLFAAGLGPDPHEAWKR